MRRYITPTDRNPSVHPSYVEGGTEHGTQSYIISRRGRVLGRYALLRARSPRSEGTGVHITHLSNQRLRKQMVESTSRGRHPLYPTVGLAPALLERLLILRGDVGQVQDAAVSEVNAGVHGGGVYTRG